MKNILSLIVIYFVLTGISWATNYGSSLDGKSANITFGHTADCDSARAWFGYDGDASGDDTSNFYYSIKLLPCFNDDKLLMADNVGLDSIGTHIVKLVYFVAGPDSGSVAGIWLHENPNLIASDNIGINWGDITNKGTTNALNATTTKRSLDEYALLTGGASGLDRIVANQGDIYTEVANIDGWNPITDNDSLIIDRTSNMPIMAHINYDSMLAHAADFKATGFATSADGDSVTQAIADANKENFKFGGADSVRSYLAEHDSTLLEQAAATGGTGSELCSLLLIDSNSNAVSGLTWTVKDSAGNDLGIANTNAAGWATFNIDQHDSVHAYPTERAGISLATYYAEPVPNNGFCDTITATIWNYTVAGGGMCNLHINTRDLRRRATGYGRWKMTVEYSEPGGYTDTTGGFLQWGGMEETAFKDSGLLEISVPQTWRALLYDSVTDTYTDSGLVNIRIYREDNLIREFFKVNVPRDSTQYDVLQLMMK